MQETQEQPVAPVAGEPAPAPEQQAPEQDGAAALRQAMAHNFLQHCIHAAIADQPAGSDPAIALLQGAHTAITDLLLAVLNTAPERGDELLNVVAGSIASVSVGERQLSQVMMEIWAIVQARNGNLGQVLGSLRDVADRDAERQRLEQMQRVMEAIEAAKPAAKRKVAK